MIRTLIGMLISASLMFSYTVAFALSDEDYNIFLKNSSAFSDAEIRLNERWRELKNKLLREEYERLLTEQRQWLREERDKEADLLKGNLPDADAYAAVTMARANELSLRYNLQSAQKPDSGQNAHTLPKTAGAGPIANAKPGNALSALLDKDAGQNGMSLTKLRKTAEQGDAEEEREVVVNGVGTSEGEARQQAYRNAIQSVIGTMVVSETLAAR